jgi:uncharacterized protein (TIGR02271 family)
MINNRGTDESTMGQQFAEGMPVYDAGGEKAGTLREYSPQGGYLLVQKGWLFPKDVYVPLNAIARSDASGIYLNLYKDDLKNQSWENPPTSDTMTTATGAASSSGGVMGAGGTGTFPAASPMVGNTGLGTTATPTPGTTYDTGVGTSYDTGVGATGTPATPVGPGDVRVPVREEELIAGKQQQEAGRVHLSKEVVEEQQTVSAPVTQEQVYVERVPVQGDAADLGPDAFTEQDVDVPVMGEQLVVGKQARVNEEVRLRKQAVTEEQQATGTVRKERVNVEGVDEQGRLNAQPGYSTESDYTTQPGYGTQPGYDAPTQTDPLTEDRG